MTTRYTSMQLVDGNGPPRLDGGEYAGLGVTEYALETGNLTHSESMEITNDPRFFQDSVLSVRLAAFAGLGVVAGLMVQNSFDHLFDMSKRMSVWNDVDGVCQFIAFVLLIIVQFLNVVATYVGVAQPYHTIRLMSAGPSGFEASACYYLNPNISIWRHFAVTGSLVSMPIFLVSTGLRMVVKFDRENFNFKDPKDKDVAWEPRIMGIVTCCFFLGMSLVLTYIHRVHFGVFNEKYKMVKPQLTQHRDVLDVMTSRMFGTRTTKHG
ncbi:unnamed protein product [Effrenium voratum]|uniref:Uncharacterized protein n=1 Tax=Effrenium voratum TaxID=2562239 RepID=A0AA36N706_9DINO|nr:unnamed protein product [Effrenium voratum]CAJ1458693.1 unnamed protein product [Effrenium voratum]